ncbi:MAG: LUD domain-containing protein [Nitrososphaerota archaeon]
MVERDSSGHEDEIVVPGARTSVEKFLDRCKMNGFQVSYVQSVDALISVLADWASGWGARKIVLGGLSKRLAERIRGEFTGRHGYTVLEIGGVEMEIEEFRTSSLGVFRASAGITETGGLVVFDNWASNLASLIPEYSVALLEEGEILQDYWELARLIRQTRPGGIAIISGPSSTSDIELTHIIGVHGPIGCGCIVVGIELDEQV